MKTKTRNILAGAAVAVLSEARFGGIATLGNHKAVAEGQESALDLLNGFTCRALPCIFQVRARVSQNKCVLYSISMRRRRHTPTKLIRRA